jgi:hydroxymethylbilane synthase
VIRIATRSSALAKAQAGQVAELLGGAELVEVSSDGEPGDKARFVRGVERALLDGEAEIGVHSAKDLPAEMPDGLAIAAVPSREDPADVWIGVGGSLEDVPEGAGVGTASLRRRAQLLAARPDLRVSELHGNVDTRLRKLAAGELDAIVLAAAGLRRLGREDEVSFAIPAETMTPAAGQGALVLQTRDGDGDAAGAAAAIGDETALRELTAERAVVALLEATCASPIGVRARVDGDRIEVEAFVGLPDGSEWLRDRVKGESANPVAVGALLAERLLGAGARELLDRAEQNHPADGPKTGRNSSGIGPSAEEGRGRER